MHVELRRLLPAPPSRVWALWTTREGLETWFFPAYLKPTVRELDLRPGGRYRIVAPGLEFEAAGAFVEVVPGTRLRMRAEFAFNGDLADHAREDEVRLEEAPEGCALTFRAGPMPDEATRKAVAGAWSLTLSRLEEAIRRNRSASPSSPGRS